MTPEDEIPDIKVGSLVLPRVGQTHNERGLMTDRAEVGKIVRIEGERALVQYKSRAIRWFPLSALEPAAVRIVRPSKKTGRIVPWDGEHRGER